MIKDREKLLNFFQEMKDLEASTRDYYVKVSLDRNFSDQEVKDTFERISKDEKKHSEIMGKIIDLIKYNI